MGIRIGFVFAALALGLSAAASPAATVTVGGNVWDVSTITGSFAELEDTLIGQAWWGDGGLAYDLAEALGSQLDFPNNFGLDGPYFAFLFFEGQDVYTRALTGLDLPGDIGVNDAVLSPFDSVVFATAVRVEPPAPVPLPAGGLLLLTGLAAAFGVGKRHKKVAA